VPLQHGFGVDTSRLNSIAAEFGTPVYVLDLDRLGDNLDRLVAGVGPDKLLYSLKTNYLPEVTRVVREHGLGVDVVSGYELRAAISAGFDGDQIVFNGPVKTPEELAVAVDSGIFVNIDSEEEIDVLAALARERNQILRVGLRVFPPDDVYRTGTDRRFRAVPSKFGWPIDGGDAQRIAEKVATRPELRLSGLHCHLGSQITSGSALRDAIGAVVDWMVETGIGASMQTLNFGGGFPVPGIRRYLGGAGGPSRVVAPAADGDGRLPDDPITVVRAVRQLLADRGLSGPVVCWEPGRAVVSDTMVLLTTVMSVKRTVHGNWVMLDGGLNLIPTAGPAEWHDIHALSGGGPTEPFFVAGPMCYEGDVFSLSTDLPGDIGRGDLVAIHDAGAYTLSRATSFNRPRAAVVAVNRDDHWLCWRAETDADIFSFAEPMPTSFTSPVQG
jgi:diaminopimelate decarboxylase